MATCSYGAILPTKPCSLHPSQLASQVGTSFKSAMKIRPRDELSRMLILGIRSHALPLRHDTVHKEQRSEQKPKRNLVSLHPLLLVIAPSSSTYPLG